jgi:hypothetical protein
MSTRKRKVAVTVGLAALLTLAPARAHAALFTLDDFHVVAAGGTVGFYGTVTRENSDPDPLFLDGLDVSVGGLDVSTDPFFLGWPISTSTGFGPALLFELSAPLLLSPGIYTGSASIEASDGLGTPVVIEAQDFSVEVQAVPEPATLAMLATALAGMAARLRRRR